MGKDCELLMITKEELLDLIPRFLDDYEERHSNVQIDHFIIGNAGSGHPWGMYCQAMRELNTRRGTLQQLGWRLEELSIDYSEKEAEYSKWDDSNSSQPAARRVALEMEKITAHVAEVETQRENCAAEAERILKHANTLKKQIGELTPEKRQAFEEDFWVHRLKLQLALSAIRQTPVSDEILSVVPNLPERMRLPLKNYLENPGAAVEELRRSFSEPQILQLPE
jgi:hypothetical protein